MRGKRAEAHTNMQSFLPSTKDFRGKRYKLHKRLGRGANGEVGLYRCSSSQSSPPIVIKANYCGDPAAQRKGEQEARVAQEAARRCAKCSLTGDSILRVPLATEFSAPCSFVVYPYFEKNLSDWLADTLHRTPEQVRYIFQQLVGIVTCLQSKGLVYTDLKPSNFLVSGSNAMPKLTIGDLGGLQEQDKISSVEVSAGRLPKDMREQLDVSQIDRVTSYLLGAMALELLVRPSRGADASHPLDAFFDCLNRTDSDSCVGALLHKLKSSLCPGLSLTSPVVRELVAAALALLGYRSLYMKPKEVANAMKRTRTSAS